MKKKILFPLVAALVALTSCSEYNEVVKSDDYARKLEVANEYYDKGTAPKVNRKGEIKRRRDGLPKTKENTVLRAVTLYEQIYQQSPKSGAGELSYFRIGKSYYIAKDYYMAGYYLGQFYQRFAFSVKAEEALFLSAMCSVNNSPSSTLDQTETELAINDLQQFIDRYPNSTLLDSCNNIIDKLRFKLESKAHDDVMLYSKTERHGAAVSSALTFLADYPMSQFNEEVHFTLVKHSYLLAKNSIESKKKERIADTRERYSNFVALYPTSKHLSTLESYDRVMEVEESKIKVSGK